MSNRRVQLVAVVVVLVFAGGIALSGDEVKSDWLRFFGAAVFAAVLILSAWEQFVWKWPPAQRFRNVPTNLNGTWKGTLTSLWEAPDGSPVPPKDAYLVVRQTASTASVVLLTDESRSRSSLAAVQSGEDGVQLNYIFLNSPAPRHEVQSRMHRGGAVLDVSGRPAVSIEGRYWTDRESRGELSFSEHSRLHADSVDAASALFE